MLLAILEILVVAIIILLLFTQIVIPLLRKTKLFPIFSNEYKLRSDIESARQKNLENVLKNELNELEKKIIKEEKT